MITLKEIDEMNLDLCEDLERKSNRYVGGPMHVIGEAYVHRDCSTAYGIYDYDTMVGLVLLLDLKEQNKYSFTDFFIADNFQGRGFAMEAVKCIVDKFKTENKYKEISLLVHNTNEIAINIYEKNGFKHSGKASWDENFLAMSMAI